METCLRLSLAEIEVRVCDVVASQLRRRRAEIHPGLRLMSDLHVDSLELIELMMEIEDEFGVSLPDGNDADMVYKSVFTRRDFRLSDFAELVYLRQGMGPQIRRKRFGAAELSSAATKVPFTQLGGSVDVRQYLSGELFERLVKNQLGYSVYRRRTDGMLCVLIPEAMVTVGSDGPAAPADEGPVRQVRVERFLIDQEPVSTTAFCRFLNSIEGVDSSTLEKWFVLCANDKRNEHELVRKNAGGWEPLAGAERLPMMLVSWFGANAYSRWAHRHSWDDKDEVGEFLPCEAQWEYAARGSEAKQYPWGDAEPTRELATFGTHVRGKTYRADQLPMSNVNAELGMSPFGLHHMAGNVWQWCRDWYGPGVRSERGGSWVGPAYLCQSSYRRGRNPIAKGRCLGFRCVSNLPN